MNDWSQSHPETDPPWQLQNAFPCFMSVQKHPHAYIHIALFLARENLSLWKNYGILWPCISKALRKKENGDVFLGTHLWAPLWMNWPLISLPVMCSQPNTGTHTAVHSCTQDVSQQWCQPFVLTWHRFIRFLWEWPLTSCSIKNLISKSERHGWARLPGMKWCSLRVSPLSPHSHPRDTVSPQ